MIINNLSENDDILDAPEETDWKLSYPSFFDRMIAALIDIVVLAIPLAILSLITNFQFGALWQFVVVVMYHSAFESGPHQASIGKRFMGIIVTNLYGEPIDYTKAMARNTGKYLSALLFLIGYIMAAFTTRRQALHDLLTNTLVIRKFND